MSKEPAPFRYDSGRFYDEPPSFDVLIIHYRQRLRNALARCGVPSNPAVDDDWILDRVIELMQKGKV